MIKTIYENMTFIVAFMVFTLFFNMMLGKRATEYFLMLVLASMVVVNADKFTRLTTKLGG